jgi:hypothetical protein
VGNALIATTIMVVLKRLVVHDAGLQNLAYPASIRRLATGLAWLGQQAAQAGAQGESPCHEANRTPRAER